MNEAVDILCITAHPDDVEIGMGGTVLKHVAQGHSVGLVELTGGELGTRGSAEVRKREATEAANVLGAQFRYQLGLRDGFFRMDEESLLKVVVALRRHRPRVVLANAIRDRHPDHGRAASLVAEATFLSGLRRIATEHEGIPQEAWRPVTVLHCVQDRWIDPDVVIDVSTHWERKMDALKCFASQFHDPKSTEPVSPISVPEFLPTLQGRALEMGRLVGSTYGEGFTVMRPPAIADVMELG
jgi:bacillithiol biosynthesis deacetylase BshB1